VQVNLRFTAPPLEYVNQKTYKALTISRVASAPSHLRVFFSAVTMMNFGVIFRSTQERWFLGPPPDSRLFSLALDQLNKIHGFPK
jgi:hypothetical protein